MRLTVLGCAGTFPGPHSCCSSYLVEHDGFRVVLDLGNGATGALQRHGGLRGPDAIVISHLHADHCIDLIAYSYSRFYDPAGRAPTLPVWGPAATADRISAAMPTERGGWLDDVYDWRVLDGKPLSLGPFVVTTTRTNHPIETYALRLEAGGRSLVYSADTGVCPALVDLARDADLFLCEATFLDGPANPPDVHLTAREAGEHAAAAGARSLLLTHLVDAWGDEQATLAQAKAAYAGELRLARDGESYPV